jgi:hypothetical protein
MDFFATNGGNGFTGERYGGTQNPSIAGDLTAVFAISLGLPGIVPMTRIATLTVVSLIIAFLINDPIKVLLIRKFWRGRKIDSRGSVPSLIPAKSHCPILPQTVSLFPISNFAGFPFD